MKEIPQQVSESVRRRNPHLYGTAFGGDYIPPDPPKPRRIRQSTKPLMNKLEGEWLAFYGKWFPVIYPQSIRFKLANGVWYKPDFIALKEMTCWEIKGPHAFRGGFENLKVAAHQYTEFKWVLCWKADGGWKEQVVLP